ncbi:hypothetical protein AX17_007210 [Amanita inopinata Kibby_2008]|nr:hypothetical protein AX17_007210 [Amanita inopinata Kibby_2008]
MSASPRLRIAICGSGIAGLTMAVALSRYPDIQVEIYEQAVHLAEVGTGITMFPRPWDILKKLGLEDELLKHSSKQPVNGEAESFFYRKGDQEPGIDFYSMVTDGIMLPLHRPELQKALMSKVPPSCQTHTGKRLKTYVRKPEHVELVFDDGTTATCDMLVGADGIKSAVRRVMLTEKAQIAKARGEDQTHVDKLLSSIDPVWTGQTVFRVTIPGQVLRDRAPGHRALTKTVQYVGVHGFVIGYPIVTYGDWINIVAFRTWPWFENTEYDGKWVSEADGAEVLREYTHWEHEVHQLLGCIDKCLKWAVHAIVPMDSYVHGRVVLAGDAAHAMLPHQGSGAGQAIEDAYMLSSLLGNPKTTRKTLDHAIQVYDDTRKPFANGIYRKSRLAGHYMMLHPDVIDFPEDEEPEVTMKNLAELGDNITENWSWSWRTRIDSSVDDAVKMLEEKIQSASNGVVNGASTV